MAAGSCPGLGEKAEEMIPRKWPEGIAGSRARRLYWYQNNKIRQNEHTQRLRRKRRLFINALKIGKACFDCGNLFEPYVLQFDHRPGETKQFTPSRMVVCSEKTILRELAKCDLVCANCHAIRTHRRVHTCGRVDLDKL